jgi:hypothetical protein
MGHLLNPQRHNDRTAARVFPKFAVLTGGAVLPFDLSSLGRLRELLGAVAVAVRRSAGCRGGRTAVRDKP